MSGGRTTLVGRERHLREVRRLVDGAASSRGGLLVLSGEGGAGKTRLAEEATEMATNAGFSIAWATCWTTAGTPLSAWLDLLTMIDSEAAPIPHPPAGETDPETARAMLVRALASQLRAAVGSRPTLVVVDDLQWCDPLSLHAIEALVGSLRVMPLAVVLTFRDDGDPNIGRLSSLTRAGRHLVVPPLNDAELADLAAEVTGRKLSSPAIAHLRDRTAGNVLYALEVLARPEPDGTGVIGPGTGSRATALFAGRLGSLSPPCLEMLHLASVIGRRFRLDVLAETLGADVPSILALVDEAQVAGLVRESGIGAFEFSHPLMTEACYAAAPLPRRARLHRDVGEALERLRDRGLAIPFAELAHQYAHAAAAGAAPKAVQYAAAAGRDNMDHLAYEDAAREFSRALAALELCPTDDRRRADLLLELGDAHAAAGDLPEARSAYEAVVRAARQNSWPDHFARAALGVGSGPGGFEVPPFDLEQVALLEEAAALAGSPLRSHVLARLSVALSLDASLERRAVLSEEAIELARSTGDALALGYALASWCDVIAGPADVDRRCHAGAEILACAAQAGDTRLELLGRRLRIVALLEAGAIDDVDGEIAAFASRAERLGQVVYGWYVPLWKAMRVAMEGQLDVAERFREDAERLGERAHSTNAAMLTASHRAMLRCELRDPADAVRFFQDLSLRWPGYGLMVRPALAYSHAAGGDVHRAVDLLATVDVGDFTVEALGSELLPSLVMLAHAAWLVRDDRPADALYAALLPFRARHAIDGIGGYHLGSIERPLGLLAALSGDHKLAAEHLDAALAQHRRLGAWLLVAATLRDAAEALDDQGMAEEADAQFAALGLVNNARPVSSSTRGPSTSANVFRREGELWLVGVNGRTVRMRDTKGMRDLARLLAQPGVDIHVLDLVAEGPTVATVAPGADIDRSARDAYRARLHDIEIELAEADDHADLARSERLHQERDALVAELSAAYGLGGRSRRRGDSAERARSTVTQRVRDAITRIEVVAPELAHHLGRSVRTGTYCSYVPEHATTWEL